MLMFQLSRNVRRVHQIFYHGTYSQRICFVIELTQTALVSSCIALIDLFSFTDFQRNVKAFATRMKCTTRRFVRSPCMFVRIFRMHPFDSSKISRVMYWAVERHGELVCLCLRVRAIQFVLYFMNLLRIHGCNFVESRLVICHLYY